MKGSRLGSGVPLLVDLKAVATLAAHGLSLAEIYAELGLNENLPKSQREAAELAFTKGRASGIAQVKRARFQAALEGKTSAQSQVLKSLDASGDAEQPPGDEFEVVRKILTVPDEETGG